MSANIKRRNKNIGLKENCSGKRHERRPKGQYLCSNEEPLKEKTNKVKPLGLAQKRLQLKPSKKPDKVYRPLPQATQTHLYDEHWTAKQERGFIRWLNHMLVPMNDYKNTFSSSAQRKGLVTLDLNQTNSESVFSKHHNISPYSHRFTKQLRRASCLLYQSHPMSLVISRLEDEIKSHRLLFREDCNPHTDLGMKQDLLYMILHTYNPLWLEIGLETVFGEMLTLSMDLGCGDIQQVLESFILDHMLSNQKFLDGYVDKDSEELSKCLSQFILKKFLLLVLFLDRAKLTRLIDFDPCLFQKSSRIKSTRELIQIFSCKYLHGEGDIIKHLAHIGYTVTHIQTALEEYDLTVSNLSVDLRDGLRLNRLTELLTGNWKLSQQLRVPAATKMQKLHNIEIALTELKKHVTLPAGVTSTNIAEGHREKTLALLWTIIFHFKVKLQLDEEELCEEIKLLQKVNRHPISTQYYNSRRSSLEPNIFFESSTLSLLLQWCREVCAVYGVPVNNFNSSFSDGRVLCYLIHYYHPSLLPIHLIENDTTCSRPLKLEPNPLQQSHSDDIGRFWTCTFSPTTAIDKELQRRLNNERSNFKVIAEQLALLGGVPLIAHCRDVSNTLPDEKVIITYVSYLCQQLLLLRKEIKAAKCIQAAWRAYSEKKHGILPINHFLQMKNAAIFIQRFFRAFVLMKKQQAEFKRTREAALICQNLYRAKVVRNHYLQMKTAAICIQRYFRTFVLMRQQQAEFKKTREAALICQNLYRAKVVRNHYLQMNSAAICVQRYFRAFILMRQQLAEFKRTRKAALICQNFYRAKVVRNCYLQVREAAIVIQQWYRVYITRKAECENIRTVSSAITIQRWYRKNTTAKFYRRNYIRMKSAVLVIQSYWRGCKVRKTQHNVAIVAARNRILKANASAEKSSSIHLRLPILLYQLLHSKYLSTAANILSSLELMSSVSQGCAVAISSADTVLVLLNLITQTNRSSASLIVVKTIVQILVNLCKWESTSYSIFEYGKIKTILIDLMTKVYANYPDIVLLCCDVLLHGKLGLCIQFNEADVKRINALQLSIDKKLKLSAKTKKLSNVDYFKECYKKLQTLSSEL